MSGGLNSDFGANVTRGRVSLASATMMRERGDEYIAGKNEEG